MVLHDEITELCHTGMALHLGIHWIFCHAGKNNGPQDYSLKGPSIDKFFFACNSLGTIAFAFNTVILPEISVSTRLRIPC